MTPVAVAMDHQQLVECIFEAITVGDEEAVERCLGQATIETVLEFDRAYGESPLHLCVKIGGMTHLSVVRCLLASGLFDSTVVDGEGHNVLECAYATGDTELVEELIKVVIDGLDDATACYRMMRHDSLQVFKMYLAIRRYTEAEEFSHIANTLIELSIKNFPLSEELRIFAQWKLSEYGFRNLSGNWPGSKDPEEWKQHIAIIDDCWRVIREQYNTRLYADVDDQFLHRLQVLHNHFYFLKHKQSLAYLPLQEAIFCVAIYLSIFRNSSQFHEYRLMVNKCMVIEFVRMVCAQLTIAKKYLENTEADLLQIATQIETSGTANKDQLIGRLMEKIVNSALPNRAHVVKQLEERVKAAASNRDALIKDMMDKTKKIDKQWTEQMGEEIKQLDKTRKDQLIHLISKRLRHVSHPQNVATRLMAEWKKGKPTATIVAGIVSGESFNLGHLMRSKDRRIKRKLLKCYVKTKQFYSLHKIVFYCEQINTEGKMDGEATVVDIACMKRVVQVLGEAVKNTQNSANMPGKAQDAISTMLTALFPDMNKTLREVFSHTISLKKVLLGDAKMKKLCSTFSTHMGMVKTAFQLLYVVSAADVRHSFYGVMRQCNTFERMRSLLRYVDSTEELERRQLACHGQVSKYFREANATFAELRDQPVGKTPQFDFLAKQLEVKFNIVKRMDKYFEENADFGYTELRRACFSSDDLPSVHRLLDWKLTMHWANQFYRELQLSWHSNHVQSLAIEWMDFRALKYNPSIVAGVLKNSATVMDCTEEFEYILHTRTLAEDIGVADAIDEAALEQLNKRLKPYYNNLFFSDNKWRVLESFCKERKLPWNRELTNQRVKRDQANLQGLFDDCRKRLRLIMEAFELHTLEGLTTRMYHLPTPVLAAIEFIQLELCEMLSAVGYFGDSFHYVKHRIPMLQGKNFRNFLAHDALSYNLLTDSSMEKIVINAFVLSTTEVSLFGNHGAIKSVGLSFPTVEATHHWVDVQQRLLGQFRAQDVHQMHAAVRAGGEIKSNFCNAATNTADGPVEFCSLTHFVNPCSTAVHPVTEYLERYFTGFKEQRADPEYQLTMALNRRDYEAAFNRTVMQGDRVIRDKLFSWPELMARVRQTDLFIHLTAAMNRKRILSKLIEHGNEHGVREMLPYFDEFAATTERGPLGDALLYCVRSIANLLVHRTSFPHPAVLLLSIMLHWHDIFTTMMARAEIDAHTHQFLLVTTVQARNYTAALYLIETEDFRRYLPAAVEVCCTRAARIGEQTILRHLLEMCTIERPSELAKILHEAALKRKWNCVKLLLERDVPVDVLFAETFIEERCTFLILVKFGQSRLLDGIETVNRALFGTIAKHPLAVAIANGMTSGRMVRALRRLGFDWLDNSCILHEAIRSSDKKMYAIIKQRLNECHHHSSTAVLRPDHFGPALDVLQRWKMISYVEETKFDESSLFFAVRSGSVAMVEELLSWGRKTRTLEGGVGGVLGGIVFQQQSAVACFGKRTTNAMAWNTRDGCEDMITRLECCASLEEMVWQHFTIESSGGSCITTITFSVLAAVDEIIERPQDATVALSDPESLPACLRDLLAFSNNALSQCTVVFAKFTQSTTQCTKYFWHIEQISCMYDVKPPGSGIDLTATVNFKDCEGETPLHKCFPVDTLEMVQVLVENGANPLLADNSGYAGIHLALLNSLDYAVGRYLLDECIRRELRNEKGVSVVDLDDGAGGNKLVHFAVASGRTDIIDRLLRQRIDVSVVNSYGVTPAQFAAGGSVNRPVQMVQKLLEYDATIIDKADAKGNTLLHYAARENNIELLEVILQHKPNLIARNELTALGMVLLFRYTGFAKRLLEYAIENSIQGITQVDEDDTVILSLVCNDYELSKGLLEYELRHTLADADERDLPRLKTIVEAKLPRHPELPIIQLIQVQRFNESQQFLDELLLLCTTLDA